MTIFNVTLSMPDVSGWVVIAMLVFYAYAIHMRNKMDEMKWIKAILITGDFKLLFNKSDADEVIRNESANKCVYAMEFSDNNTVHELPFYITVNVNVVKAVETKMLLAAVNEFLHLCHYNHEIQRLFVFAPTTSRPRGGGVLA